jgi:ribonuclease T2
MKILISLTVYFFSISAFALDSCMLPSKIDGAKIQPIDCQNDISPDSYVLALSWSPQHCSTVDVNSKTHELQCKLNKFGFVVHGLWGQNDKAQKKCDQPRNCGSSTVTDEIIKKAICIMPGVPLIQGQWQKHGTCTGMTQDQYFDKTIELWDSIVKPDISSILNSKNEVSVDRIVDGFVKSNTKIGIFSDAVAVQVGNNNRFKEVFICYDVDFKFAPCKVGRTPLNQIIKVTLPK